MKIIALGDHTFYASNMARWPDIKTIVVKNPNKTFHTIYFDVDKGEMVIDLNPPIEERCILDAKNSGEYREACAALEKVVHDSHDE